MPMPLAVPNNGIEPIFEVSEDLVPGLADKKVGQRVSVIINYSVTEKTKSFTELKIDSIYVTPVSRRF